MSRFFLYAGGALLIGLAILLAIAASRPDEFRVERRLRMAVPPDKLWPLISELRAFNRWNPYERKDPAAKGSYEGPATGVGSRYAWEGKEIGTGSMEIIGQQPGQAVQLRLDFLKPFEAHNQAEFRLVPQPDGSTEVVWAMFGPSNFINKLMGVVFNIDKMVGQDFENGLAHLQQLSQEAP